MSDTTTSGSASVAPAETVSVPSAPATTVAPSENTAPAAAFGSTKGSGLARGKRPGTSVKATASNSNAASGDYKPTAIQIVQVEREYTNPFAPAEAPAPVAAAPVAPVVESAPAATPVAPVAAPVASPAPQAEIKPVAAPAAATASTEPAVKAELKILPPEEKARPAQSWESDSFRDGKSSSDERPQRREDRPIFRTERARRDSEARPEASGENRSFEQRREPREPRAPRENREPRSFENKAAAPAPAPEKKSGGFFGWLKNLFAEDPKPSEAKPASDSRREEGGERRFDGNRGGRRHHRGGRGRGNGDFRGEGRGDARPEGQPGERREGGGERRFEGNRGGRGDGRRHHRGGGRNDGRRGRGDFRGERRGGDSRPSDNGGSGPTTS